MGTRELHVSSCANGYLSICSPLAAVSCSLGSTCALRVGIWLFLEVEVGVGDQLTLHLHKAL